MKDFFIAVKFFVGCFKKNDRHFFLFVMGGGGGEDWRKTPKNATAATTVETR